MFGETLKLAYRAILRNVLRSALTMLGIVIGVGAVIAMVTTGEGTTAQVTSDVAKLGTNLLMIRTGRSFGPGGAGESKRFDISDVDALESQIPSVRVAAPSNTRTMTAVFGSEKYPTSITGTDNRFFDVREWQAAKGRLFNESELRVGSPVCIIGNTVRQKLFGSEDPLEQSIRFRQVSCRVVGVLATKGVSSVGQDQDDIIAIPLKAFQRRVSGNPDVNMIFAAIRPEVSTDRAQAEIEQLLRERRRIAPGEEDDFSVMDMKQIASMLTSITGVLTGLLGSVAAVSLLVGGIGIMNIMLVSVTERTREIGIRLAVGAQKRQVLMQFLVEAIVLSLFGGVTGIAFGLGLALIATWYLEIPFIINPNMMAIAFLFSAAVGVVFGYFPARRAAGLDPIEALRHE
jgi:putative ABC transport system permease protein